MYQKLVNWFEDEPKGEAWLGFLAVIFGIHVVYVVSGALIMSYIGTELEHVNEDWVDEILSTKGLMEIYLLLLPGAFAEEIVFRMFSVSLALVPLLVTWRSTLIPVSVIGIATLLFGLVGAIALLLVYVTTRLGRWYWENDMWTSLMTALVVSSIIFGYIHGGAAFITMQGFSGVLYFIVVLKGGAHNGAFFKPLLSAGMLHFSFNATILTLGYIAEHVSVQVASH